MLLLFAPFTKINLPTGFFHIQAPNISSNAAAGSEQAGVNAIARHSTLSVLIMPASGKGLPAADAEKVIQDAC